MNIVYKMFLYKADAHSLVELQYSVKYKNRTSYVRYMKSFGLYAALSLKDRWLVFPAKIIHGLRSEIYQNPEPYIWHSSTVHMTYDFPPRMQCAMCSVQYMLRWISKSTPKTWMKKKQQLDKMKKLLFFKFLNWVKLSFLRKYQKRNRFRYFYKCVRSRLSNAVQCVLKLFKARI